MEQGRERNENKAEIGEIKKINKHRNKGREERWWNVRELEGSRKRTRKKNMKRTNHKIKRKIKNIEWWQHISNSVTMRGVKKKCYQTKKSKNEERIEKENWLHFSWHGIRQRFSSSFIIFLSVESNEKQWKEVTGRES